MKLPLDLKHAFRSLTRTRSVTGAAVLCLALGIGAVTAVYSAVHSALLASLPYPEADRLVAIYRTSQYSESWPFSPATFLDLRRDATTLTAMAAMRSGSALLQDGGESDRVSVVKASGELGAVTGIPPLLGRMLRPDDDPTMSPPVAVISEELWRSRYGADPGILGRTVRVDSTDAEIVGVVPRTYRLPRGDQVFEADVWLPLPLLGEVGTYRFNNSLSVVGRLADGQTVEAAQAELRRVMAGVIEEYPSLDGEQVRVVALREDSVRSVRKALLLLLGAAALVLLVGSANVASLLLARGAGRARELAVRRALGAGRGSVIRSGLTEAALVGAAGVVFGVVLGWVGVGLIRRLLPPGLPQLSTMGVTPAVLALAATASMVVVAGVGLVPAWQANRIEPQRVLRSGDRSNTGGGHQRFLRGLIAVEVALSIVLLLSAGLVLQGFEQLTSDRPGFDATRLLTATVTLPLPPGGQDPGTEQLLEPILAAVEAAPGVESAASINLVPYVNWGWNFAAAYEGREEPDEGSNRLVENRYVTPGFFETAGIELVEGRLFEAADRAEDAPYVVIANEALARRDFPGESAVGQRIIVGENPVAIVGVVANIKNVGPLSDPFPEIYWNQYQRSAGTEYPLLVRTEGDPGAIAGAVREAVLSARPDAAVSRVQPMTEVIAASVGRPRFYMVLMNIFAGAAVLLALSGLYGVMAYVVAQRSREMGIRSALGSSPRQTTALVLRSGMRMVLVGVVAGILGGAATTRLLTGLIHDVSPLDTVTFSVVPLLLIVVAAGALLVPAFRAARVDPVVVLKSD